MENNNNNKVEDTLRKGKTVLIVGIILLVISPMLLTLPAFWSKLDFSTTGPIGDTIGGITSPIVNLIGAILVFLALDAQIQANKIFQKQVENDRDDRDSDNSTQNLNQLYDHLASNINNFKFRNLVASGYRGHQESDYVYGSEAFYRMFDQIFCNYHGNDDDLSEDPCVSELYGILNIMQLLLTKLETTNGKNSDIIKTLISQDFKYKIMPRLKNLEDLGTYECSSCNHNHGLPKDLETLIKSIRLSIN